jgi:type IV pilus biogenesis protein CpaD/CtpE
MKRIAMTILAAMLVSLAGCGEAQQDGSDYVAEPRRVPKPKQCSDYANEPQILLDEQAGRLTKADKQWLDMDGDGRYCEEPGVAWKGEQTQASVGAEDRAGQ